MQCTRRLAALLLAFPLLAACDQFSSFESVCEQRLAPATVEVITRPVSYTYDFSQSIDQLTARGGHRAGTVVLGLVETGIRSEVTLGMNGFKSFFRGGYCMRPRVAVQLAFDPMTLYVASEQPEGSCAFRITMEHELKHVAVYQEYLEEFGARVSSDLGRALGDGIVYVGSRTEADAHVRGVLERTLAPYMQAVQEEVRARQARVDSPAEYALLDRHHAWCAGR
ncbi:MAG: hypothetical protein HC807_08085 [Gammaproteobacteria bacterium]|nr:hypothetical protein [Gammaproteobacteria bacterium]